MADVLPNALGLPPDHDHFPTEIAAWFGTPERCDDFAADIIEWCRWLALPAAERGEAAREWWCEGQGGLADAARRDWLEMPDEEREAITASWLAGLPSYTASRLYIAWAWHAETGVPVRPSLVVATACALALATWADDGQPVPMRAIRDCLGLPGFNDLPGFLTAARLDAGAALRGEHLNDKELAKLAGVTGPTIAKWRPELARFADSRPDCFFPLGLDGVPDDPTMTLDAMQAECAAIAEALASMRADRASDGERRSRQTKALPVKPRAKLFGYALAIARNGWPVPETFLHTLAHALGIVSPVNGRLMIARNILDGLGLPVVKEPEDFRRTARLDGEELRKRIGARRPDGGATFKQAWAKANEDLARSIAEREWLLAWFRAEVARALGDDWSMASPDTRLSVPGLRDRIMGMQPRDNSIEFGTLWAGACSDVARHVAELERLHEWFGAEVKCALDGEWLAKKGIDAVVLDDDLWKDSRSTVLAWKMKPGYRRLVYDAAMWDVAAGLITARAVHR